MTHLRPEASRLSAVGLRARWEDSLTLTPIPGAVPTPTFTPGVPGVPSCWPMPGGPHQSRKIEGRFTMGEMPGVRGPPRPSVGAVCKWEVGLVSLGSPSSQLGEQNGSGKDFRSI